MEDKEFGQPPKYASKEQDPGYPDDQDYPNPADYPEIPEENEDPNELEVNAGPLEVNAGPDYPELPEENEDPKGLEGNGGPPNGDEPEIGVNGKNFLLL